MVIKLDAVSVTGLPVKSGDIALFPELGHQRLELRVRGTGVCAPHNQDHLAKHLSDLGRLGILAKHGEIVSAGHQERQPVAGEQDVRHGAGRVRVLLGLLRFHVDLSLL